MHAKNHLNSLLWFEKTIQILFLILLRLLSKYKKPSYMVSIFFMLLKIPPFLHLFLLLSRVYSLHKVKIINKNCWRFFKMLLPRSVIFLKIRFPKGLQDMSLNFLHKDREAIQMPLVCAKNGFNIM